MTNLRRMLVGLAGAATFAAGLSPDDAAAQRRQRGPIVQSRPLPTPMLAVVGLREQRIIIYDSNGARMLESGVSSGSTGYETPPGVFSVVQKEYEHHSNLYDDASMPFMQRLTWTGIALHAGALPGYPASHGCVRLPHEFADDLFGLTKVGMRVVVAREGIAPVAIDAPPFFKGKAAAQGGDGAEPGASPAVRGGGEARIAALESAAEEAAERAREARSAAARARNAVQPAERAVRPAEAALAKAEADLKAAEKLIAEGAPPKRLADAEKARAAAPARIEAERGRVEKAQGELKAKLEAARIAEEKVAAAAAAQTKALEAVEEAKQRTAPVSVFVSRKTQRLYVRKAFHPVWEGPVVIRDADKPIGTFVFTANDPAEGSSDLRWSVVSLYKNPTAIEPAEPRPKSGKRAAPPPLPVTDAAAAQAALGRISLSAELPERIMQVVLAGSSLIISDEPPSIETGKDTDFVVIMSGEPQGGIAMRQQSKPERPYADDGDFGGNSRRARRPSGGGGYGFGLWFN